MAQRPTSVLEIEEVTLPRPRVRGDREDRATTLGPPRMRRLLLPIAFRLLRSVAPPRSAIRLVGPLTVLLGWELAARFSLVNTLLVPPPSKALADLMVLIASGYLWKALYASLFRVVCGFALAVAVGMTLGLAMARIRLINDFFDPLVELLRPISALALFPLAILWFGIGDGSKIFVIAFAASFPVILNTFAGARSIDANPIRAARSLGATELAIFRGIVLPASWPHIFTGVRLASGVCLIVIIAAEMVSATVGMGYMVLEAQQTFRTERVFAGIFVIGVIGFATDLGLRRLRRWLLPWYRVTES